MDKDAENKRKRKKKKKGEIDRQKDKYRNERECQSNKDIRQGRKEMVGQTDEVEESKKRHGKRQ